MGLISDGPIHFVAARNLVVPRMLDEFIHIYSDLHDSKGLTFRDSMVSSYLVTFPGIDLYHDKY